MHEFHCTVSLFEGFSPPYGTWKKWNLSRLEPKVAMKTVDDGPSHAGKAQATKTDGTVIRLLLHFKAMFHMLGSPYTILWPSVLPDPR